MLDGRINNEQRELFALDQFGQQKGVFRADCPGVKDARLNIHPGSSNGESGSIQVSKATVGLKQVILEGYKPQFLYSANQC
jgi:hypothetical protein